MHLLKKEPGSNRSLCERWRYYNGCSSIKSLRDIMCDTFLAVSCERENEAKMRLACSDTEVD